jgi:hypothetical protein
MTFLPKLSFQANQLRPKTAVEDPSTTAICSNFHIRSRLLRHNLGKVKGVILPAGADKADKIEDHSFF